MSDYQTALSKLIEAKSGEVPDSVTPQSSAYQEAFQQIVNKEATRTEELGKRFAEGITFGASEIIESVSDAAEQDIPYDIAEYNRQQREDEAELASPYLSLLSELAGGVITGGVTSAVATAKGVPMAVQGAVEGGVYGAMSEGPEAGIIGAGLGFAIGKGLDTVLKPKVIDDVVVDPEETFVRFNAGEELSDDEMWDAIYNYNMRRVIETNRRNMLDADELRATVDKLEAKAAKKPLSEKKQAALDETKSKLDEIEPIEPVTLAEVQRKFTEGITDTAELNKVHKRIADLVTKRGGLRHDYSLDELAELDKIFTNPGPGRSVGPMREWLGRTFLPVAEVVSDHIDPRVGRALERAAETAVVRNAGFTDRYVVPMRDVITWAQNNAPFYRLALDAHNNPKNIDLMRDMIRKDLGDEATKKFDNWWNYTVDRNGSAIRRLFREPAKGFDAAYVHMQTIPERKASMAREVGSPYKDKFDSLQTRSRKPASQMTDEEVLAYENPFLSHSQYVSDQELLLELQQKFGLRPNMEIGADSGTFRKMIEDRLLNDGFTKDRAEEGAALIHEMYIGSRRAPPPAVRAFMNFAYAGTLAQFKSAVLNTHDIAVSAVNNGRMPTMKAVMSNMDEEFGRNVRSFLGDQSVGEFRRDFDKYISDPDVWSKISRGSKIVVDGSMFLSGFRYMDELGKGVVLRAAVENAREAARNGTFRKLYGDLFRDYELKMIEPWLRKGTKAKDMPPAVRQKVEELAFTKLGEQQLISAAGRPLGYLSTPLLRPAYAMTGFAIKQMALLRRNVYNELKAGNPKAAAEYAARYVVYAGFGYGMLNETRNAVFKGDEFEPEGVLMGVVDQVAAAMTINRLGDSYSREMFLSNPVEFLMGSFLPPGGLVEAFGRAAVGDFEEILYRTPAGGDLFKRLLED